MCCHGFFKTNFVVNIKSNVSPYWLLYYSYIKYGQLWNVAAFNKCVMEKSLLFATLNDMLYFYVNIKSNNIDHLLVHYTENQGKYKVSWTSKLENFSRMTKSHIYVWEHGLNVHTYP